ncbi:MAG: heavy-metal-associated domain-containing protein [Methanosarcina sp.]|nr:heavy-metal-associated domain-containing protein [Methanosarcina sp.]MDD3318172.1 heavy-metal-associated domain-containing protein [Methanosarcina sp.]
MVDDLVCRYCKDMVTRLIISINGVSRVSINIPEKTINIAYDSRITDAYVIQMALLKAGYKTIEEPGKIY